MESEVRHEHAVGVGTLLRSCRLKRDDDLLTIARVLRIRQIYLQAIEEGRFGDLPGPTYAVGFVRAYAEHLGLDSYEVIRRFKGEISGIDGTAKLHFPSPKSEGGSPKWAVVIGGAIFALVSYGVWYVNSTRDDVIAEFVTSVPERLGQLLSPGGETDEGAKSDPGRNGTENAGDSSPRLAVAAAPAANQPGDAPTQDVPPVVEPTAEGGQPLLPEADEERATAESAASPETPMPATAASNTEVATAASRQSTVEPAAGTDERGSQPGIAPAETGRDGTSFGDQQDGRIVLRAKEESWIQVRDETNDRVLLARLLRPGDTYRVPDRSGLNLWTGNAGGLEILVDGEMVPSIGDKGAVRRRVALEVEPLRSGAAVR
jgi:cytoskeleton protein RodZ